MSDKAKDAYHIYHVALGTKDPAPFEHLSMWEQSAWGEVSGYTQRHRNRIEELTEQVRRKEAHIDSVEYTLDRLKEDLTEFQDDAKAPLNLIELSLRKLADTPSAKWDRGKEIADARRILEAVRERIAGLGNRKKAKV